MLPNCKIWVSFLSSSHVHSMCFCHVPPQSPLIPLPPLSSQPRSWTAEGWCQKWRLEVNTATCRIFTELANGCLTYSWRELLKPFLQECFGSISKSGSVVILCPLGPSAFLWVSLSPKGTSQTPVSCFPAELGSREQGFITERGCLRHFVFFTKSKLPAIRERFSCLQ